MNGNWFAGCRESAAGRSIAALLLPASVCVLATPLLAKPAVLLTLLAFICMLLNWLASGLKIGPQAQPAMTALAASFGFWFAMTVATTLLHHGPLRDVDSAFRFLIALGAFWIVLVNGVRRIEWLYYGMVAGAVGAAGIAFYQHGLLGMERAQGWTGVSIYFGNLSILLAIYVIVILASCRRDLTPLLRNLLVVSLPLALYASYTSMSRSSFLALASLWVLTSLSRKEDRRATFLLLLGTAAVLALLTVAERNSGDARLTSGTLQEIQTVQQEDYRSSLGHRLQMWKGALVLFSSAPIAGVGTNHYMARMEELAASGVIDRATDSAGVSVTDYNQAHSGIMDTLATRGILGLVGYLLLFAVPYRLFSRLAATSDAESLLFCRLGMTTVIAFFIFGLTNSIFRIQIYSVVYSLSIAIFTALALNFQMQDRKASALPDERTDT